MVESDAGFVVRAGSEAALSTSKSIATGWLNIRKKLVDAGVLKQAGDRYVFCMMRRSRRLAQHPP